MRVILASASPRRHNLLKTVVDNFEIIPSDIDESGFGGTPHELVTALSRAKAQAVYDSLDDKNVIVIGADTIVVFGDKILGKPTDKDDAVKMLEMLSNATHEVYTGVAVVREGRVNSGYEVTKVKFGRLENKLIKTYIESGAPMDKAGSYGLQDLRDLTDVSIEGNADNVIGLPTGLVRDLLSKASQQSSASKYIG